jgi:hypothetical protein
VGHGRAECRHHGVAHELLDEAAVRVDDRAQLTEEIVLEGADVLGVEPLGEGGEARDVGEEDGDGPAVRLGGRGGPGPGGGGGAPPAPPAAP